jgi:hypothetical protein
MLLCTAKQCSLGLGCHRGLIPFSQFYYRSVQQQVDLQGYQLLSLHLLQVSKRKFYETPGIK